MADNRIPPLVPARKRRRPTDADAPAVGPGGNWILRAGHRPLYVEPADPPAATDKDEQPS